MFALIASGVNVSGTLSCEVQKGCFVNGRLTESSCNVCMVVSVCMWPAGARAPKLLQHCSAAVWQRERVGRPHQCIPWTDGLHLPF
jgi:hypothetical protein